MSSRSLWCSSVLLPAGWAHSVLIEVDANGVVTNTIANCSADQKAKASECIEGIVIPGMPNLHSHAHQRAMAGLAEKSSGDRDNFWSWRSVMYQMLEQIGPDQIYDIARMLYLEMLQGGYTHVAEFQYLHHQPNGKVYQNPAEITLQCLQAARDVGIGFTALPVLYQYGGFGEQAATDGQKRFLNNCDEYCTLWHGIHEVLQDSEYLGVAPHSLRAISQPLLRDVLGQLPESSVTHLHISEQTKEVDDCIAWSGQRPMAWLMDHFAVDHDWCLIHATHLDDAEKKQFVRSGAVAGLCPTTEANLGDGLFDLPAFASNSGIYGVGTDSQISVSITEELRWLEYGQRLSLRQRNILAHPDWFDGHCGPLIYCQAVAGGSKACGLPGNGIAIGSDASFVVLDPCHSRMSGDDENTLLDSWIFSAGDSAIAAVYTNGRKVIDQGRHNCGKEISEKFQTTLNQLRLK